MNLYVGCIVSYVDCQDNSMIGIVTEVREFRACVIVQWVEYNGRPTNQRAPYLSKELLVVDPSTLKDNVRDRKLIAKQASLMASIEDLRLFFEAELLVSMEKDAHIFRVNRAIILGYHKVKGAKV